MDREKISWYINYKKTNTLSCAVLYLPKVTLIAVISDVETTFSVVGLNWSHVWFFFGSSSLELFWSNLETFSMTAPLPHIVFKQFIHAVCRAIILLQCSLATNDHIKYSPLRHTNPRERAREREDKQQFICPLLPNQNQSSHAASLSMASRVWGGRHSQHWNIMKTYILC